MYCRTAYTVCGITEALNAFGAHYRCDPSAEIRPAKILGPDVKPCDRLFGVTHLGTAKIPLGHSDTTQRLFRIDPVVAAGAFSLDNASKLRHLIGVGHTAARDFLPTFRAMFLGEKREAF